MKLVFIFVALLSLALAANTDPTEPPFAVYSSPDTLPVTEHVSIPEALAILCQTLPGTWLDCNKYCDEHFNPIYICPKVCDIYRTTCGKKIIG